MEPIQVVSPGIERIAYFVDMCPAGLESTENNNVNARDEALGTQAKEWKNKIDELRRDVRALHLKSQGVDWLFCFNNLLTIKLVVVNLPRDFKVPKDMFEGRRDP
ncbi:hypothetical protein J1N35_040423 [Gossypium stocksii]|uniref:Uncharacterized protein n=1 Tax=Gossypium stocksii TaxID=47602 RepID=A0A9D3ZHN9_9ROSI|nr:hypothetical protein J1N35_040423 [Gossypium stocksii]